MFEKLFSEKIVVSGGEHRFQPEELYPVEAEKVRNAIDRRCREFASGRGYARLALERLGIAPCPIPVGVHRQPIWPDGVVGSITHCADYCAAAVGWQKDFASVGIDVEVYGALDPSLAEMIATSRELSFIVDRSASDVSAVLSAVFSIKESVFKCLFPLTGVFLDFHDIEVEFEDDGTFCAHVITSKFFDTRHQLVSGRYCCDNIHVFSVTSIRSDYG